MSKTLQQILGGRNITGVIQSVAGGVPDDLLPPALMTPGVTVDGDTGSYLKVESTREAARRSPYGAKSREREKQGISETPVKLIHTVENIQHDPMMLMNLRGENGDAKQRIGEQTVARQTAEFGNLFKNLRLSSIYSAFSNGAIYFDSAGELQTSSSTVDVDFQIPSGNQGQFNTEAGGGGSTILASDWDTASSNLIQEIKELKTTARKRSGLPLRHVLYGRNILDYILGNDQLKVLINESADRRDSAAAGEIPNNFLGFTWWSVDSAFTDIGGTITDWFGDDDIVFFPEPSNQWYELMQGTYPVPTSIDVSTGDVSMSDFEIAEGMFGYSHLTADPPGAKQIMGDTFLPVIKNPNAVFTGSVPTS